MESKPKPVPFGRQGQLTCDRKDCGKPAVWYPVLCFFAKGYRNAPPLQTVLSMAICEPCTGKVEIEHLLTEDGWGKISQALKAMGKAEADRARTQLRWWPIADAQAGKFPT